MPLNSSSIRVHPVRAQQHPVRARLLAMDMIMTTMKRYTKHTQRYGEINQSRSSKNIKRNPSKVGLEKLIQWVKLIALLLAHFLQWHYLSKQTQVTLSNPKLSNTLSVNWTLSHLSTWVPYKKQCKRNLSHWKCKALQIHKSGTRRWLNRWFTHTKFTQFKLPLIKIK